MKISLDIIKSVGGEWLVILDEKENGAFECLFPDGQKIQLLVEEQLDWDSQKLIDSEDAACLKLLKAKQKEVAVTYIQRLRQEDSRRILAS